MSETVSAPSRFGSALRGFITGIAGLAYAYLVWNAVAYLITMAQVGLSGYGWFVLLFAAVFPGLVFAAALLLGRKRTLFPLVLVLVTGVGLSAVFWLDVLSSSLQGGLLA